MGIEVIVVIVAAVLVVIATSLVKTVNFSEKTKQIIALVASAIAGGVSTLVTGSIDTSNLLGVVAAIYGVSQLVYQFILNGTKVDDALERFPHGGE